MATPYIHALLVVGFVAIHLFAGKLRFLHGIPRSRWLSFAGGASVAYVFLHVFPELEEAQARFARGAGEQFWVEHAVYLLALAGLVTFYSLERVVKGSQQQRDEEPGSGGGETTTHTGVFWLHMASFAVYNGIVGYLLAVAEADGLREQLLFFLAIGLHFVVNDYGLREDHRDEYDRTGRWVLAVAIMTGWLLGLAGGGNEVAARLLFAFIAGGVVLNVMKEELPAERQSRLWAFAAGVVAYAALLVMM